jgi:hypothetical protein
MQEVKNIILEITESLPLENEKYKETSVFEENNDAKKTSETKHLEDEDNASSRSRNWNRGIFTKFTKSESPDYEEIDADKLFNNSQNKRSNIRRQTMIRSEAYDEWDRDRMDRRISRSEEHSMDNGRMNQNDYMSNNGLDEDLTHDNYLYSRDRYYSSNYARSPMRDPRTFLRSSSRERYIIHTYTYIHIFNVYYYFIALFI